MAERFYMLRFAYLDQVKSGKINVEELGYLCCLALMVNPVDGKCLTDFSMLARELNDKPGRVKYVFEKLKERGLVYFETQQGKKGKSLFFVLGLEMVTPKGAALRIVTPEYIAKTTDYSEVISHFQKLSNSVTESNSNISGTGLNKLFEVPYIYIEKEKKIEKENKGIQTKPASKEGLEEVFKNLVEVSGYEYAKNYFQGRGYSIPN